MKTMLALAATLWVLSGCAVYDGRGGYYGDGYKKPHPHGCPPARPKKAIADKAAEKTRSGGFFASYSSSGLSHPMRP